MKQSIDYNISPVLTIIDFEVIIKKYLSPANLTKTLAFDIYELTELIMINKDKKLIFTTF